MVATPSIDTRFSVPRFGTGSTAARNLTGRNGGDKPANNGDNPQMRHLICVDTQVPEISPVISPRLSVLLIAALAGCMVLQPWRAHAQWWSLAPADFEACADVAEKAPTKEEKKAALTRCNAKFAGRRKPGGGYTYYDFMQDRTIVPPIYGKATLYDGRTGESFDQPVTVGQIYMLKLVRRTG